MLSYEPQNNNPFFVEDEVRGASVNRLSVEPYMGVITYFPQPEIPRKKSESSFPLKIPRKISRITPSTAPP